MTRNKPFASNLGPIKHEMLGLSNRSHLMKIGWFARPR